MKESEEQTAVRRDARAFEQALSSSERKELGQFFTGLPLGRILAYLVVEPETKTILDPMAGVGDLLDSASEAAYFYQAAPERLDGIEIDEASAAICQRRLKTVFNPSGAESRVVRGDAFASKTYESLAEGGYDLVITNPPYVRYQSLNGRAESIRIGLSAISEHYLAGVTKEVWSALARGYSGLADLSVPAWLLSGLLVRPGGRLAMVVPATWRSRDYADVIRYLLLRCFQLELIVEDTQPGWFSDALVRTHLIIAQRLSEDEIARSLVQRGAWPQARWVQVAPDASGESSLVGGAFSCAHPEAAFAAWCFRSEEEDAPGLHWRPFFLEDEWRDLWQKTGGCSWMQALEKSAAPIPLFAQEYSASIPETLRDLLPSSFDNRAMRPLDGVGISTGQGLRTGCNRFFYVRLFEDPSDGLATVVPDPALGGQMLAVPAEALIPVLHRQADLELWREGMSPRTRVLDLRGFVLPEDFAAVRYAAGKKITGTRDLPAVMPEELAAYVREAARTPLGNDLNAKPVPELSAVKTNARPARGGSLPRFWYMLPDFKPRHLPQAFVPRIIHATPHVYKNTQPPILIDANFSTFWSTRGKWTPAGLAAFLNSSWCRAIMEALGTPLGGGALKLEAGHLRKMPVPDLGPEAIENLNQAAAHAQGNPDGFQIDQIVLGAMLAAEHAEGEMLTFAKRLNARRSDLSKTRQGGTE
ncbi:N-6 DNA methylase [Halorhodospira halochloris]|uniref:Eco57I restriction-modification methylase domain-containing protein n=1 Tax=Halorhodospira halochloris TaxID=1052 RepID=UPI001EE967E2|nr:N-6 DNA methylase [Halorhodospira halochloris]